MLAPQIFSSLQTNPELTRLYTMFTTLFISDSGAAVRARVPRHRRHRDGRSGHWECRQHKTCQVSKNDIFTLTSPILNTLNTVTQCNVRILSPSVKTVEEDVFKGFGLMTGRTSPGADSKYCDFWEIWVLVSQCESLLALSKSGQISPGLRSLFVTPRTPARDNCTN